MDPKDWFSNCEKCGKKYETRFCDNRLCEDCNNPQKKFTIEEIEKILESVAINKSHNKEHNYFEFTDNIANYKNAIIEQMENL